MTSFSAFSAGPVYGQPTEVIIWCSHVFFHSSIHTHDETYPLPTTAPLYLVRLHSARQIWFYVMLMLCCVTYTGQQTYDAILT